MASERVASDCLNGNDVRVKVLQRDERRDLDAEDASHLGGDDNADDESKFGAARNDPRSPDSCTTTSTPRETVSLDEIRARILFLDGPIAVRLASLTFVLDAFCERVHDATTAMDFKLLHDVIRAIMRTCRDLAPNLAYRARGGMFRVLETSLEREPHDASITELALKSIVFIAVEHSTRDEALAHVNSECERVLQADNCDELTQVTLQLVIEGRYSDAAQALCPTQIMRKPIAAKKSNALVSRRRHDIDLAKKRRIKADETKAAEIRRHSEEEERRALRLQLAASNARNAYLKAASNSVSTMD